MTKAFIRIKVTDKRAVLDVEGKRSEVINALAILVESVAKAAKMPPETLWADMLHLIDAEAYAARREDTEDGI